MRNHVFFDLSGAGARHFDNDASLGVERVEGPVLHVVVPEQKQEVFGVLVHTVQLTQHFALDFRVDSSRQHTLVDCIHDYLFVASRLRLHVKFQR